MTYLIHTCPDRRWYVDKYLVPQMTEQGIRTCDIFIYEGSKGNLTDYRDSLTTLFAFLDYLYLLDNEPIWHLQDDIVLSPSFAAETQKDYDGIVCGACIVADNEDVEGTDGFVHADKMWWSFQCIRIPTKFSREFLEWLDFRYQNDFFMRMTIQTNRNDDMLFKQFLWDKHPDEWILNLKPNIVEHVDYLLGGSVINQRRPEQIRARYFEDFQVIEELKEKLRGRYEKDDPHEDELK